MSITQLSIDGRGASLTQTAAIPLTTIFTPPFDCTAPEAYDRTEWAGNQWAFQLDSGVNTPSCYPSSYSEYQSNGRRLWYSPGVCPHLYEYVATSIRSAEDAGPATTLAICCPPGVHDAPNGHFWSCGQVLTSVATDLTFSNDAFSSSTRLPTTTVYANPISVAWQEKDLSLFMPASAPLLALSRAGVTFAPDSSTSQSTSSPSTSSSPATSVPSAETAQPKLDLSSGAAAGIGVGATVAVISAAAGLWWLLRNYKFSRRRHQDQLQFPAEGGQDQKSYLPSGHAMAEAPDTGRPYEADYSNVRVELEGRWHAPEADKGIRSPI
ncbi:hypothetical protein LTR37_004027 [Vermiconidia calcicola]|uniref:Uncharacterized protein n=1 Tax=Vermiconidia calcicola TaxID=1690605 RepID=A0ACC3NN92_9PEZI|nr:hypothetical protein LTR37_004027 [Vermiconidia calcicola]